jgi:hypothetical protein
MAFLELIPICASPGLRLVCFLDAVERNLGAPFAK